MLLNSQKISVNEGLIILVNICTSLLAIVNWFCDEQVHQRGLS